MLTCHPTQLNHIVTYNIFLNCYDYSFVALRFYYKIDVPVPRKYRRKCQNDSNYLD